ncbi:MAG: DUF1460 domain-containing protein [Lacunisphaera sp.]|nr:DUF1460 domain-containing protein [Lacunisphaera sp.]
MPRFTRSLATIFLGFALGHPTAFAADAAGATTSPAAPADKPLYQFTEAEVGPYLDHLQATEPDLRKRIVHLARKNLGQPYELYLLGEMPFETYDPQPIYCLGRSDCLVFAEHTLAMALTRDWSGFMLLLQRIRYRDGHLGVVTRNHFTETDWNPSNRWLARDITNEIPGGKPVKFFERIDRAKFLLGRYHLKVSIPVEDHTDTYFPYADVALAAPQLRDGDLINVVRGIVKRGTPANDIFGGSAWIGHVGLVAHGADGSLHIIHSSDPMVREETIDQFIARETAHNAERDATGKARLLGFKFLRLEDDPLANLRQLDGAGFPHVTLPGGARLGGSAGH